MNTTRLGELISPVQGRAGERQLPVYSVTKHKGFVPSSEYFKKQVFSSDVSTYKVVHKGQFAYATIHLDEGSIGVAPTTCVISPMYTVFSVDEARVAPDYLIRFLKSPRALASYPRLGRGTAERRKSISLDALGRLEVPLPPLPEQRRIAAILDEADALRATRSRQRSAADDAANRYMAEILQRTSDHRVLGSLLAEPFRNGISPSRSGTVEAEVLTLSSITRGSFDPRFRKTDMFSTPHAPDKLVIAGVHLICRGNGNADLVGTMAAATETLGGVAFPDTMIAMRPSPAISSATLLAAWRGENVREQIRRGARTTNGTFKINQQVLASILVPVPSPADQSLIDSAEEDRDRLLSAAQRSEASLDELFASLQHRAFRGEL